MSATAWTVGRYVVETLAANGIDTVFGIPGVHNIELYRGLEFARLRHVLVRHEQNAGFAADGYARVSGCAAAAFVISGPGVTNALTAIAQAARCASWWRRSTATSSPPWPARARWRRATPPASARVCRLPRPRSWWQPPTWWWRRARSCPKPTSTPPPAWR